MPISQQISAIPAPPTLEDPVNFNARAIATLTAQASLASQLNTFASQANTLQTEVNSSASYASTSARDATAAATAALANANATVYSGSVQYAYPQVVVGSDGISYRCLSSTSVSGDNPVDSVTGNWLALFSGTVGGGSPDLPATATDAEIELGEQTAIRMMSPANLKTAASLHGTQATATPGPGSIPKAGANGRLDKGWLAPLVTQVEAEQGQLTDPRAWSPERDFEAFNAFIERYFTDGDTSEPVTANAATWDAVADADGYLVEYRELGTTPWSDPVDVGTATTVELATLGLTASKTWQIRVSAFEYDGSAEGISVSTPTAALTIDKVIGTGTSQIMRLPDGGEDGQTIKLINKITREYGWADDASGGNSYTPPTPVFPIGRQALGVTSCNQYHVQPRTTGRLTAFPFALDQDRTLTSLDVNVLAVTSGSITRWGLYADNGSGKPGGQLLAFQSTSGTTGVKTGTASYALDAHTRYWAMLLCHGAQTSIAHINFMTIQFAITVSDDFSMVHSYYLDGQSALPANGSALAWVEDTTGSGIPVIRATWG